MFFKKKEGLGGFNYKILISFIISWVIVYFSIWKGAKLTGKIARFTVLGPYIIFIILLLKSFTLDGSKLGLKYLFLPKLKYLFSIKTWYSALDQNFFQSFLGYGGILMFATFRKKEYKVYSNTLFMTLANYLTGLLAAVVIFSYLGFFSKQTNVSIDELPLNGPELIFLSFPASLDLLPFTRFWLFLFFFSMILIGIDSQFALLEILGFILIDFKFKWKGKLISEKILRLFVCIFFMIFGIIFSTRKGFTILTFFSNYVVFLPISFSSFINYHVFYKNGNFKKNMKNLKFFMNEEIPNWIFFCLEYIVPFSYLFIVIGFIFNAYRTYIEFGIYYFSFGTFCIIVIISFFFILYIKNKNSQNENSEISVELIEVN